MLFKMLPDVKGRLGLFTLSVVGFFWTEGGLEHLPHSWVCLSVGDSMEPLGSRHLYCCQSGSEVNDPPRIWSLPAHF